jgi:hypothetical protein
VNVGYGAWRSIRGGEYPKEGRILPITPIIPTLGVGTDHSLVVGIILLIIRVS